MATGYTDCVQSGKVTSFQVYALQCARAFGACTLLRDDPLSSEIPVFESSDTYKKWLEEAQEKLSIVRDMSSQEAQEHVNKLRADLVASWAAEDEERSLIRQRYEAMLEKARKFVAPTPEHESYAKFIVEQLEESIRFDCSDYSEYRKLPPDDGDTWKQQEINSLLKDIARYEEMNNDEIVRTMSRNNWINDLRKAIDEVEESLQQPWNNCVVTEEPDSQ